MINTIGTFVKLIPLVIFVGVVSYFLNYAQLTADISHTAMPGNHVCRLHANELFERSICISDIRLRQDSQEPIYVH
ncbi:hypothetical protein QWA_18030 [Alcaligenes faecalis subsp. faecalis NCIB 8687]|nr:hypothetical protein QWA_18030 [Alcaligenes faecalis subsp. faecalis NCIB 8687]